MGQSTYSQQRARRLRFAGILQDLCGITAWESLRQAETLDVEACVELQAAANELNRNRSKLRAMAAMEELAKRRAAVLAA